MTYFLTTPGHMTERIAGPIEVRLDFDGRIVDSWIVQEWNSDLAREPFDVGPTTYCPVAYTPPRPGPNGRLVATIFVQPDLPPVARASRTARRQHARRPVRTARKVARAA
jgi:hypothetical protein